jgi:hypothetical protein
MEKDLAWWPAKTEKRKSNENAKMQNWMRKIHQPLTRGTCGTMPSEAPRELPARLGGVLPVSPWRLH